MFYYKSNRSLSPHLFLYKSHITSILSIFHRIAGFCLSSLFLLYPVLFLSWYSFISFNLTYYFYLIFLSLSNIFYYLIIFILFYHTINGFRHFLWDFCIGLNLYNIFITGFLISSISLFVICFLIIL